MSVHDEDWGRGPIGVVYGAAAAIYGAGVRARGAAYDRGWLSVHRADRPVISVGNVTAGGTGKTPFTVLLARRLAERACETDPTPDRLDTLALAQHRTGDSELAVETQREALRLSPKDSEFRAEYEARLQEYETALRRN